MSAEVCEKCCKWAGDHKGKSPQSVADDYPKMMAYVLKHEFNMPKEAATAFIENACSGNWERLHETHVEKAAEASEYADMLRGDVWYCSDRWSWDRVIRIQWLYQRLLDRVGKEEAEQ